MSILVASYIFTCILLSMTTTANKGWMVVTVDNQSIPMSKASAERVAKALRKEGVAAKVVEVATARRAAGAAWAFAPGPLTPPRDLAVLVEEIQSVRYCPLQEVDARVMRLALRLANAEGLLWEMQQGAGK